MSDWEHLPRWDGKLILPWPTDEALRQKYQAARRSADWATGDSRSRFMAQYQNDPYPEQLFSMEDIKRAMDATARTYKSLEPEDTMQKASARERRFMWSKQWNASESPPFMANLLRAGDMQVAKPFAAMLRAARQLCRCGGAPLIYDTVRCHVTNHNPINGDCRLTTQTTADVMRCIFGDPFLQHVIDERWRTSTVIDLAWNIYGGWYCSQCGARWADTDAGCYCTGKGVRGVVEPQIERMSILADALMDAGCDDEYILNHCRHETPCPNNYGKGFHRSPAYVETSWECLRCRGTEVVFTHCGDCFVLRSLLRLDYGS